MQNPFKKFLDDKNMVILDGAMATELENRGANLNHYLWSAKILTEEPGLIRQVHLDYLNAGADVITTASYQASFEGFSRQGYTEDETISFMQLSVRLAIEAVNEFCKKNNSKGPLPLIAASVGPYGASLADGSEYRGNYGLGIEELKSFHRKRMKVLVESGADLLACETIPCTDEAIALVELLAEFPDAVAWISFSCVDGERVCSGESFARCVEITNQSSRVVAVGINCTAPIFVEPLLRIAKTVTNKLLLAYPNKGEIWDANNKCWMPGSGHSDFFEAAQQWRNADASLIGGCCRTTPQDISKLRESFIR